MKPALLFTPAPRRTRRRRKQATPPTAALTLVAVQYQDKDSVRLTFDRAIDIAAIDPSQFVINDDAESGLLLGGISAGLRSATMVEISLDRIGTASESGVHLTASASTGIVAVDDGAAWAGVTDLALPFP